MTDDHGAFGAVGQERRYAAASTSVSEFVSGRYRPGAVFPENMLAGTLLVMNSDSLRKAFGLLMLLTACRAAGAAGAVVMTCPSPVDVEASANAPAGWEWVPSRNDAQLMGVTIYSGHPRDEVSLMPSELPSRDSLYLVQWDLHEDPWLECWYTGKSIARQLPNALNSCIGYYKHSLRNAHEFLRLACERGRSAN